MNIIDSIKVLYEVASNSRHQAVIEFALTSLMLVVIGPLIIWVLKWKSNKRLFNRIAVASKQVFVRFKESMKSPYDDKFPSLKK
jgi:hypothetical protein